MANEADVSAPLTYAVSRYAEAVQRLPDCEIVFRQQNFTVW